MKLSCHCKNIELEVADPDQVNCCNCSICSRYQALWGYYEPQHVKVNVGLAGEDVYIWNDREIEFVRCSECGCVTHYRTVDGQPEPTIAVNFRMAPTEVVERIPVRYSNGQSL